MEMSRPRKWHLEMKPPHTSLSFLAFTTSAVIYWKTLLLVSFFAPGRKKESLHNKIVPRSNCDIDFENCHFLKWFLQSKLFDYSALKVWGPRETSFFNHFYFYCYCWLGNWTISTLTPLSYTPLPPPPFYSHWHHFKIKFENYFGKKWRN